MYFQQEPISTTAHYLLHDSRQVSSPINSIFFAIKGLHHDGHRYVWDLYRRGVREFVVESAACTPAFLEELEAIPEAKVWQVANSILAMQDVARQRRETFTIPVIGITGSNGKTIVKEWLYQLLINRFKIVKSPKSYNSQIGVPLSVWQMNDSHSLAIFEAGISLPNEMDALEKIIQPSIGIFTNIGTAHSEFFENNHQKIQEKLKLFRRCKTLIYCADYVEIDETIRNEFVHENPACELVSWSRVLSGGVRVDWQVSTSNTSLTMVYKEQEMTFDVPFTDEASIENCIYCILVLLQMNYNSEEIQVRLQILRPVSMRLELKQGINGNYLIDDTYNNDLAGLTIAMNFLAQQQQRPTKVVILSDVLESGMVEHELYHHIAHVLKEKEIAVFIGIGETIVNHYDVFMNAFKGASGSHLFHFFKTTEEFIHSAVIKSLEDSVILVKGARLYGFEEIVKTLVQKTHGTVLETNLDAITHNLNYFRDKIGRQTKIMVMVKAFAYGSGSAEVANLLQFHGVDYLAVAYTDEGVTLRQNGIYLPIMVMNASPSDFEKLVKFQLEPEIYSLRILQEFANYCKGHSLSSKIHIKLDTGMHRLGFEAADIPTLLAILAQHPFLHVATIFSHLVGADEAQFDDFTQHQIDEYNQLSKRVMDGINHNCIRHLANSAGIARFPQARFDMVRLGVGLYGVAATPEDQLNLMTVGTLKTVISQIKHIKKVDTVGYSRRGVLERDTITATIAIGYADGYDRGLGRGVGEVLVAGKRCKTVGNVCMDMTMIDITDVPNAKEGDEVIVFGDGLSIAELATKIGTISYEIITGVSERVKRIYYQV